MWRMVCFHFRKAGGSGRGGDVEINPMSAKSSSLIGGEHVWCGTRISNLRGKPNQDRADWVSTLPSNPSWRLYFVADGHGPDGHVVAETVRVLLPKALDAVAGSRKLPPAEGSKSKWLSPYTACVRDAIAQVAETVRRQLGVLALESGCTLCGMWVVGGVGVVFNVGDSRAVYVIRSLSPIQITRDHKPDDDREWKRIAKAKGYVGKHTSDSPPRLWCSSAMERPGLALSRAIGDFAAEACGLTYLPAISTTTFTSGWVIIATDGLWDYVSNDRVAELARGATRARDYCDRIMAEQMKASDGGYRDDCTVVVIRCDDLTSP